MAQYGLRLNAARAADLVGLGDPLFDSMAGFVAEIETDLRVYRVDLNKRVLDPIRRLRP